MSSQSEWCPPAAEPEQPQDQSRVRGINFRTICQTGWTPLLLSGLVRELIIRAFAAPSQIVSPDLRRYLWRDNERAGILIEMLDRWQAELTQKRPAVLIKRNSFRNLRMGIGDRLGANEQGHEQFLTFWVGSHTLFCLAQSGAQVELLSNEVQQTLTGFGPMIVRHLDLLRFMVTEVGEIGLLKEDRQTRVVPVTIGWAYGEQWQIDQESMKLGTVRLTRLLDAVLLK